MRFFYSEIQKSVEIFFERCSQRVDAIRDGNLLFTLSAVYFFLRTLSLNLFEFSGDAVWKWRILRYFYETGIWFPTVPDHHQGRWAQNLPNYWLMELFHSTDPWIGCILPVLTGFGILFLVYWISRQIASKTTAVLCWIFVSLFPVFFDETSQFLPSLPSAFYTLLALYLLIRYLRDPGKLWLTFLAGLSMGFAWGCKVTVCYWCLGIGLFLLFYPVQRKNLFACKRFRLGWDVILFSIGFFCILIPETIVLNHLFHVSRGRIAMLMTHTDESNILLQGCSWWEYLLSPVRFFLDLSGKARYSFPKAALFLLSLPVTISWLRSKNLALPKKFLAFTLTTAFLCHCYAVIQISPLKQPERPLLRYFLILACVAIIILISGWKEFFAKLTRSRNAVLVVFLLLLLPFVLFGVFAPLSDSLINGDNLWNKIRVYRHLNIQKKENLPVLVKFDRGTRFRNSTRKTIAAWKTFFGDLEELPLLKEHSQSWSASDALPSTAGILYFHALGPRPTPGVPVKCLVVDEEHTDIQKITIRSFYAGTK